ncbi:MAG: DNA methyltransferase [Minisyncoccales bacterium]
MDTKIEIKILKINDIKPNPKNPKKHWVEKISESIREMGYIEPIVTDENNMILAGHGRLKALKDNGTKEIEVIIKRGLTEKQKEKYILLSNKLVEAGGWDLDLLKEFDLNLLIETGFNDVDLKNIWDDVLEIEDDDFNEQKELEKIKTTDIKIGDMFQLGNHKLLCANSTIPENIKKLMGQEKTSFIYCDPPYNISLNYDKGIGGKSRYGGRTNDHKTNAEYKAFLRKTISNALDVGSDDLHIFYYCDQKYVGLIQELYTSLGIKNQRVCLWIKNGFNVTPQIAFNKCYEPCVYGTIGKPHLSPINNLNEILNREIGTGNRAIDDILDILDIWLAKRLPSQDYEHATSKPPTLHEKALRRCTKINDIVLDLFGGSGSTLIACNQLKRRAYLMEYEPIFCQLIINRFEKITGIKAKLIK